MASVACFAEAPSDHVGSGAIVRPSQIDASQPLWDTFGRVEIEAGAQILVRFAQRRETEGRLWPRFTKAELTAVCTSPRESQLALGALQALEARRVIQPEQDGAFSFTASFIRRCWAAAPLGIAS